MTRHSEALVHESWQETHLPLAHSVAVRSKEQIDSCLVEGSETLDWQVLRDGRRTA